MNWRVQRELFGKIRRGQIWRKYHDGVTILIKGKGGGDGWKVMYCDRSGMRGKTHVIQARMIYHYFELIK